MHIHMHPTDMLCILAFPLASWLYHSTSFSCEISLHLVLAVSNVNDAVSGTCFVCKKYFLSILYFLSLTFFLSQSCLGTSIWTKKKKKIMFFLFYEHWFLYLSPCWKKTMKVKNFRDRVVADLSLVKTLVLK